MLAVALNVAIAEKFSDCERVNIDFVDALFHCHRVNLARRIEKMARARGKPSIKIGRAIFIDRLHNANALLRINRIRSDEKLVRFFVDHAIGRRSAYGYLAVNDL